jgi:hypothetical protein
MIYILLQRQKTNSIMDFYISVYNTMVFASLAMAPLIDVQDYIANIKSNSSFHLFPSVTSFFHLLPSCFHLLPSCFHLLPSVTKGIRLCSDYACHTPIYIAMTTFHRSVMDSKNNCVTLSEWYNFWTRLHARTLFSKHEFSTHKIILWF